MIKKILLDIADLKNDIHGSIKEHMTTTFLVVKQH